MTVRWSSGLGAPGTAVAATAGLVPIAPVMGSCVQQIGWQRNPWVSSWSGGGTYELEAQTDAFNDGRSKALERLRDHGASLGADLVVGTVLRRSDEHIGQGTHEFIATGTAVRASRSLGEGTVATALSSGEAAQLIAAGFWPVGTVAASVVAYIVNGRAQRRSQRVIFGSGLSNQELPDFTQGLHDTRHGVQRRFDRAARELDAHGVVGVRIQRSEHRHERSEDVYDLIMTMHMLGTAIVEVEPGDAPAPPVRPTLTL